MDWIDVTVTIPEPKAPRDTTKVTVRYADGRVSVTDYSCLPRDDANGRMARWQIAAGFDRGCRCVLCVFGERHRQDPWLARERDLAEPHDVDPPEASTSAIGW